MILQILAYKNKRIKCFTNPIFTQENLDNLETNMARSITLGGESMQTKFAHLALYHLGQFDDMSGKFELLPEPSFLFDCDDIIDAIPKEA